MTIRALVSGSDGKPALLDKGIGSVKLLGSSESIAYTHDGDGLHVTLPATPPCENAFVLKLILQ